MSATTGRAAPALTPRPRNWKRVGLLTGIGVVSALGMQQLVSHLTSATLHHYLGKIGNDNSELRVTPPSPWTGIPAPKPTPAKAEVPKPKAEAPPAHPAQVPEVKRTAPPTHHNIDAFSALNLTAPVAPASVSSDPPGLHHVGDATDQASAAFGGKATGPNLPGARAAVEHDLDRTIRPGTRIPCVLQNAIDTSTGTGDFTCVVEMPGDNGYQGVPSWSGNVTLLPTGTLISGTYQGLQNGRQRIAAAAAYATTDDGIVVPLGDPATDAEGRMGMGGHTESNWWPRIRSAVILDLAQSAFGSIPALVARSGNNTFLNLNTGATDQAMGETLRRDADIPDVLKKNQGEMISLLVTSPIYFQGAIKLRMRGGQ